MILIAGISTEQPVRLIIEAAERMQVPHVLLDQRCPYSIDLKSNSSNNPIEACLRIKESEYNLKMFNGIYFRMSDPVADRKTNATANPDFENEEKIRTFYLLNSWIETASCRVMNKASAQLSNASKPYQYQLIREVGIMTPETLITNIPEEVIAFKRKHGRLIYKSISSVRSIVREFDAISMLELHKIRFLPVQFQPYLIGNNTRVHVVGEECFASAIHTEAIDYRYAGQDDLDCELSPTELTDEIKTKCIHLSKLLKLPFCGIDLIFTNEGVYCFEVNPSPGYSYYQKQTGQDIAGSVVRYLEGIGA